MDEDLCSNCHIHCQHQYTSDGFVVCTNCGKCSRSDSCEEYDDYSGFTDISKPVVHRKVNKKFKFIERRGLNITGASQSRYNPRYYGNERRAQFSLDCPNIPYIPYIAICKEYFRHKDRYGDVKDLTRSKTREIANNAKFKPYAERWKWIISKFGGEVNIPPPILISQLKDLDDKMEPFIRASLEKLPLTKKKIRLTDRTTTKRTKRHNAPNIDYKMRLLLWILHGGTKTIYDEEFPHLKTRRKVEALDLFFKNICEEMDEVFVKSKYR